MSSDRDFQLRFACHMFSSFIFLSSWRIQCVFWGKFLLQHSSLCLIEADMENPTLWTNFISNRLRIFNVKFHVWIEAIKRVVIFTSCSWTSLLFFSAQISPIFSIVFSSFSLVTLIVSSALSRIFLDPPFP